MAKHRRFKIILHWYGKNETFWKHTDIIDDEKARHQVLLQAAISLAEVARTTPKRVYRYITEDNTQRYEVHEA